MNQRTQQRFWDVRSGIWGLLGVTAITVVAWTAHSRAAATPDDLCGATIVADLTLDRDLTCPGAGLVAGASDITIDLNGHTIAGPGTSVGIRIANLARVTVHGGTVRNFETGIMVANSSNVTVRENDLTGTREGVFLNGVTDSIVQANHSWLNQMRGIMLRPSNTRISTRNVVIANLVNDNPIGILVFGQPGNFIRENVITGSTLAGIQLTGGGASGNSFFGNQISTSAAAVQFGAGWTGNKFVQNLFTANTCALQGSTAGNVLLLNVLANNGADSCQ
jgi:parallel beta-helix repeat protein